MEKITFSQLNDKSGDLYNKLIEKGEYELANELQSIWHESNYWRDAHPNFTYEKWMAGKRPTEIMIRNHQNPNK